MKDAVYYTLSLLRKKAIEAIAADGIHFVFNEYEIACYAQGAIEVILAEEGESVVVGEVFFDSLHRPCDGVVEQIIEDT